MKIYLPPRGPGPIARAGVRVRVLHIHSHGGHMYIDQVDRFIFMDRVFLACSPVHIQVR